MFKDCHVHTLSSHDSNTNMLDYINIANEKNVNEITFTDHWDSYDELITKAKCVDIKSYYEHYNNATEFLRNNNISNLKLNWGIEIGLQPHLKEEIDDVVSSNPFDFVIGSQHITDRKDMAYDKSFFENLTRRDAYMKYFNEVYENVKIHSSFDVLGHLDYVVRYGGYNDKILDYNEFHEIIDKILIELIKKNKGIEINTSGLAKGLPNFHPSPDIVKRYFELGGKILTIGSDSHTTSTLAGYFDDIYNFLKSIGVECYTVFKNRKPNFISIEELHN